MAAVSAVHGPGRCTVSTFTCMTIYTTSHLYIRRHITPKYCHSWSTDYAPSCFPQRIGLTKEEIDQGWPGQKLSSTLSWCVTSQSITSWIGTALAIALVHALTITHHKQCLPFLLAIHSPDSIKRPPSPSLHRPSASYMNSCNKQGRVPVISLRGLQWFCCT